MTLAPSNRIHIACGAKLVSLLAQKAYLVPSGRYRFRDRDDILKPLFAAIEIALNNVSHYTTTTRRSVTVCKYMIGSLLLILLTVRLTVYEYDMDRK